MIGDFVKQLNIFEKIMPKNKKEHIPWEYISKSPLGTFFNMMKKTPQDPNYHGEGNVLNHTIMVCDNLISRDDFWNLDEYRRTSLFLAALLHDIGKVQTTKIEDGTITSPHHSENGSKMARNLFWMQYNLCGDTEKRNFRELVCMIIRYHMAPMFVVDNISRDRKIIEIASIGKLVPGFSWELLCLFSDSDIEGRISSNNVELHEMVDLARLYIKDFGCFDKPYEFTDRFSEHAYLRGKDFYLGSSLYNDTWGTVIIMCGLPGTGKDTWIKKNCSDIPMVSLDEIRKEINVKPTDNQTKVVQIANDRAKEYLRNHQPFVWNATNVTQNRRNGLVSMFERYGASVRIVYLETDWDTEMDRNQNRKAVVPKIVLESMRLRLVLPLYKEAEIVEWIEV